MMLLFPDAAEAAMGDGLRIEDFPVGRHAIVAGQIFDAARGGLVDVGEIAANLKAAGGDVAWFHALINQSPSRGLLRKRVNQVRAIGERAAVAHAVADFYGTGNAAHLLAEVAAAVSRRGPGVHGFVPADTIRTEAIWWAWEERVPLGELTLMAGFEKSGKSVLCCEIMARASRGQLQGHLHGQPVTGLYLTAEDRVAHVIVPRLTLAGADLSRVLVEPVDDAQPVTIERITAAVAAGVRMVVLDPLSLFIADQLTNGDENGDLQVRTAIKPLIALAQRYGVAIIGIKHTNKGEGRAILNRVAGARAYTAAARALLFVADDPDSTDPLNPDRLIFPRGNLATTTSALRYRLEGVALRLDDGEIRDHPHIVWRGESVRSAEEAFARSDRGPASEDPGKRRHGPDTAIEYAVDWLRDLLDGGPEITAVDVLSMAETEGIGPRTAQRAAKDLGVTRRREGFGPGSTMWWSLTPPSIDDNTDDNMTAPVGTGIYAPMQTSMTDELFAGAVNASDE